MDRVAVASAGRSVGRRELGTARAAAWGERREKRSKGSVNTEKEGRNNGF